MKLSTIKAAFGSALLLQAAPLCDASRNHQRLHHLEQRLTHQHQHHHERSEAAPSPMEKRSGDCAFPTNDPNLVAITPNEQNAGWAMSPDQPCKRDMYCPIACKSGMVMAQWDPDSNYGSSSRMNGGLYCDKNGEIQKPFPDKPNCVPGTGAVKAVNKCKSQMSWCQTVLPGNEAMLIPTIVDNEATIAVPDPSYWDGTSAHFYLNPPGSSEADCKWGDSSTDVGNWAAFVAGANTDASGNTFVTLGSNPIWEGSLLRSVMPSFGLEIECPDADCVGLPCRIDPRNGIGKITSDLTGTGAGNSDFCVVTVPKGATAHIVAFDLDGGDDGGDEPDEETSEPTVEPTTSQTPTSTPEPTTTSTPEPTTTSTSTTSTTPTSTSTSTPTPSSSTKTSKSTSTTSSTTTKAKPTVKGGVFHENGTTTATTISRSSTNALTTLEPPSATAAEQSEEPTPEPTDKDNQAGRHTGNAHMAGLIVAFIAAACFF